MCMHDGLNEVCPGRNCPCPCDACVLGIDDELDEEIEMQHEMEEERRQRQHEEMIAQDPDPFFGPF